jgi:hypothetical protein
MKDTMMDAALARYNNVGASRADDAALMAAFCKYDMPLLAGAVSPRLVWGAAQSKGMTTSDLAKLSRDPRAIDNLQWEV